MNAAVNEAKYRERRKKNVVVFGLKESKKINEVEKQAEDKSNVEFMIVATGSTAKVSFIQGSNRIYFKDCNFLQL